MQRLKVQKKMALTFAIGALALTLLLTTSPLQSVSATICLPGVISCPPEETPPPEEKGFMTGGGRINSDNIRWPPTPGIIITHGFELHCDMTQLPNGLQVNWNNIADAGSNRFHLETLDNVSCTDDPNISPDPPAAPFDTLEANGHGRYNGQDGAFVYLKFTDAGEPGRNDEATIVVYDQFGVLQLDNTGKLEYGNHQAHKATAK
jgi:hypothetical protein